MPFPIGKTADENVPSGLGLQDVKHLDLVGDMLLEAEALPRVLQEDRVSQGSRGLDRVGLEFEDETELFLKEGDLPRHSSGGPPRHVFPEHGLGDHLQSLRFLQRQVGGEQVAHHREHFQA